jgi:hypothetical protein
MAEGAGNKNEKQKEKKGGNEKKEHENYRWCKEEAGHRRVAKESPKEKTFKYNQENYVVTWSRWRGLVKVVREEPQRVGNEKRYTVGSWRMKSNVENMNGSYTVLLSARKKWWTLRKRRVGVYKS